MSKLVTTIIPVYNRAAFLQEAVDSVLGQSHRPIEIILVDDGSTDGTANLVDQLVSAHSEELRAAHTANNGPGAAREHGRQMARGSFIQYLDSDDVLLPNKFADQLAALREAPDCGIAYGITRLVDERGNILQDPYKGTGVAHDALFPHLLIERWWNTHTPLYRRETCERIGPWPSMRMGEDWVYDARAGSLGIRLAYCATPVSHHRQHGHDRLTGGGMRKEVMIDIARLLPALHSCACKAGITPGGPQMDYFARWCLLEARRCGACGLIAEASQLYGLATQASAAVPKLRRKFYLYGALARLIGWGPTGKLSLLADVRNKIIPHKRMTPPRREPGQPNTTSLS